MSPFKNFKLQDQVVYENPPGVVPPFKFKGYVRYIGTEYLVFGIKGGECAVPRTEAHLLKKVKKQ